MIGSHPIFDGAGRSQAGMIVGIGIDLCRIDRLQLAMDRHGERFVERLFTPSEQEASAGRKDRAAFLAKRFAAKEAMAKAMGTGFRCGISFRQMEVGKDPLGRPVMRVNGMAEARLLALGSSCNGGAGADGGAVAARYPSSDSGRSVVIHLSMSDEGGLALAMVVLERVVISHG